MDEYKFPENLKSVDDITDSLPQIKVTDMAGLLNNIKTLQTDTSPIENILSSLKYIEKTYENKQNDELLAIFERNNIFSTIVNFISSDNHNLSIQALSFIMNFTVNDEYGELFIENRLFYLLSDIVYSFFNKGQENTFLTRFESIQECDAVRFFSLTLSIFINISNYNELYIKRIWKILEPNLFFNVININNEDLLLKCAKIARVWVLNSNIKTICNTAVEGILRILHKNTKNQLVIDNSLCGLINYFDKKNKQILERNLFQSFPMYNLLKSYCLSNQYNDVIKEHSLNVLGKMIFCKFIERFEVETFFPILLNNDNIELQQNAFWCLDMAVLQKVIDKRVLLNFLIRKDYESLLQCSFKTLYYSASAIIHFLKTLNYSEFSLIINETLVMLFIRFLRLHDSNIQKEILYCILNFDQDNKMVILFNELGGDEVLKDILGTKINSILKYYIDEYYCRMDKISLS